MQLLILLIKKIFTLSLNISSLLKVSYFQNLGELIDISVYLEQLAAKQLRTLVEAAQMAGNYLGYQVV